MNGRRTIDELCRLYHNENAHTEHVTQLALRLFDAVRPVLKLPVADRAILAAAGRLHDVAYSVRPRQHRLRSAEIVRQELAGSEAALVAATLLFHGGAIAATRRQPLVSGSPDPARAARLGALLRVADGLDFSHLQDAAIVGVRVNARQIRVRVRSSLFPFNLERARQKADLWRATFPIRLELVAARRRPRRGALLTPGLPVLAAARRLILRQFKLVDINVAGALRGENNEPLHDIRVALRRWRLVLRMFREPLAGTGAEVLDTALGRLNRALGPPRDLDVWLAFLTSPAVQEHLAGNRRWTALVRHQTATRRLQQATVKRHLSGPSFAALRRRASRLARAALPRLLETAPAGSLEKLARRAWRKQLRQALKLARLRHSTAPEDLHRLRIALRRARYLGEFFAPVLGPPFLKLTRRLRAAEQALAHIHDTDIGLAQLASQGPPPPRQLVKDLETRRAAGRLAVKREWRRLEEFLAKEPVAHRLKL